MLRRLAHAFACAAAIAPLLVASTLVGPRAAAAQPAAQQAAAQQRAAQRSARTDPPALAAIRQDALRRDVFAMAADSMRGREAGTLDELRAAVSLADRAREAGLAPAGDDGSYLQWWPMRRIRPAASSRVALDGRAVAVWTDAAVVAPVDAALDVPLVWVGAASADSLRRLDLRGRAAAALVTPPARPPVSGISLRAWRYARLALAERAAALRAAGAVAAVLVADDSTDAEFATLAAGMQRGTYAVDSAGAGRPAAAFPVVWMPAAQRARASAARRLALDLRAESFVYPSVNVVAAAPGRDAALPRRVRAVQRARRPRRRAEPGAHGRRRAPRRGRLGVARRRRQRDRQRGAARRRARVRARAGAPLGAVRLARRRGARAARLALVRGAADGAARRRSSPVLNGDMLGRNAPDSARCSARSRRTATRRSWCAWRSTRTRACRASRSTPRGTGRRTPRGGTSAATTCPTRGPACRR
jgi:hypothetical protein